MFALRRVKTVRNGKQFLNIQRPEALVFCSQKKVRFQLPILILIHPHSEMATLEGLLWYNRATCMQPTLQSGDTTLCAKKTNPRKDSHVLEIQNIQWNISISSTWWLNQPTWKNIRQIGSFPQVGPPPQLPLRLCLATKQQMFAGNLMAIWQYHKRFKSW